MNKGCGQKFAEGNWWSHCGETDMGQTAPALCTECGGLFILAKDAHKYKDLLMMEPRGEAAGKAVADMTVAAKDPGKGHFWVSMVKSGVRCLGYGIMIGVGGPVAWAGIVLLVAEVLGIVEELVD